MKLFSDTISHNDSESQGHITDPSFIGDNEDMDFDNLDPIGLPGKS
jgi:hypothetical protein